MNVVLSILVRFPELLDSEYILTLKSPLDIEAGNIFMSGIPLPPMFPQAYELERDELKAIDFKLGDFRLGEHHSYRVAMKRYKQLDSQEAVSSVCNEYSALKVSRP